MIRHAKVLILTLRCAIAAALAAPTVVHAQAPANQAPQQTAVPQAQSQVARQGGDWCRQDLSELDADFEKLGQSQQGGSNNPNGSVQKYERLRDAVRTLAADGRYDACRMLVYEIRAMWDHEQAPVPGTNSP